MHCSPSALPSSFSRRCGQHTADWSIKCAWGSDVCSGCAECAEDAHQADTAADAGEWSDTDADSVRA